MNGYRQKLWIDRWTDHFTGPSIYGVQYNNSIKPIFLRADATKRIKQNKNNENHLPPVNLHQLMKLTSRRSNAIAHRKNLPHMQYLWAHKKINVSQNFYQKKSNSIRKVPVHAVPRKQHHVQVNNINTGKMCNVQS